MSRVVEKPITANGSGKIKGKLALQITYFDMKINISNRTNCRPIDRFLASEQLMGTIKVGLLQVAYVRMTLWVENQTGGMRAAASIWFGIWGVVEPG